MKKTPLRRLFDYCRQYYLGMAACIAMMLFVAYISVYSPELIADLTDALIEGVQKGIDIQLILAICTKLGIIYLLLAALQYGYKTLSDYITQNTAYIFRRDMSEKLTRLPIRFFDENRRGEIISRLTNDVDAISDAITKNVSSLFSSIVLFIGVTWKMFSTNVRLSFLAVGMSILSTLIMLVMAFFSQKHYVKAQKDLGNITAQMEEVYNNHLLVQLFSSKKLEKKRFSVINEELYESNWRSSAVAVTMEPVVSIVEALSSCLLMILGCGLFLGDNQSLSYGELTAYLVYAGMFSSPLSSFAGSISSLQKTSAAARRVFDVLDEAEEENEAQKADSFPLVKGDIEFNNVCFGYKEDIPVIKNMSFCVKAGETAAIVGPSGVGKTTLVNLLMRFYEIDSGSITIDGNDIKDYSREAVRSLFDMVLQDTWLFDGSLRENLCFDKKDIDDAILDELCKALGLYQLICMLPKGYDTRLSELSGISEGQRQQLCIARMMLKNAPFLILDEATSALDTRTELQIQTVLKNHMKGKTCFIIAHRLSTIRNSDRILFVKDGRIIESGTHEELMRLKGEYFKMYDLQSAGLD